MLCGCSESALWRIMVGTRIASLPVACAIETATADLDGGPILARHWVNLEHIARPSTSTGTDG